jgi:hypothetical protein
MSTVVLACKHFPKQFRLEYRCSATGNYSVVLCKDCRTKESDDFLIKEEMLQ